MGQQLVRENIVLIASLQTSSFFHVVKRQFSGANNEVTMVPFQYEQFQNFSNKILSFKEMLPVLNGVVNNLVNTNATLQPCDETIQLYQRTYKWDYVNRLNFYGWKIELSMARLLAFFLEKKWALFQCIVALAINSGCYSKRIYSYKYELRPQPQDPLIHHQLKL